ncbi:hypothetical protein HPP92_024578 [Vanilla planifolia]|uniref:Uncharacterized protein n=1 Tax=Vanilla planifolia TaxID=51239 RepID=A0A835PJW9_VANPL|nr:hypothetical protein HPP92_024578 [Vanilla planifolia]
MLRWSGEKTKLFAIWNREEDGRVLSQGGGVDRGNKEGPQSESFLGIAMEQAVRTLTCGCRCNDFERR